jgi:hypothetical protein
MQVRGDIEYLVVRHLGFYGLRMGGTFQVLAYFHAVFIVQRYEGNDKIWSRFAAFPAFAMTVAAGGVIGGEASADGFLRINLESSGAGATSPATDSPRRPLSTGNSDNRQDG